AVTGRLPLPRPVRPGAIHRPRARPARPPALVLPLRSPEAGGGGGPRSAGADRVAEARLGARGRSRGGAPDPRAPAARERAQRAARPLRLLAPPRHRARLLGDARPARADPLADARPARRPRARRRKRGGARRSRARA